MRHALPAVLLLLSACGENRTFPERAAYAAPAAAPLSCLPNLDGRIEAAELQAALDVPVRYLASPAGVSRPLSLAAATDPQGHLVWDLATDYADDQVATASATSLGGKWYRDSFPAGQFAAALDLGGTVEGVYAHDGSALLLLGYASREAAPPTGRTLVVYGQPVALYRFPLEVTKQWVSVGEVRNATVRGLPYAGRDTYQVKVEAAGRLELPDVTFTQALQVRTTTTIEPAVGAPLVRRQVGWVFECFGEVARATAADGEPRDDFTTTAELRRLGL